MWQVSYYTLYNIIRACTCRPTIRDCLLRGYVLYARTRNGMSRTNQTWTSFLKTSLMKYKRKKYATKTHRQSAAAEISAPSHQLVADNAFIFGQKHIKVNHLARDEHCLTWRLCFRIKRSANKLMMGRSRIPLITLNISFFQTDLKFAKFAKRSRPQMVVHL